MKAKGKIILSSIALVLVVTLAIVAVFALTQTSTSSSFKVNFIGTRNVKAVISARSKLSNSDTIIEAPARVTFDGTASDTATKTIDFVKEITIPSTDVTADYIFEIGNLITDESASELIVEPEIQENGISNATITAYYQTDETAEYAVFTGAYTYATLAKGQTTRFKVSVKINDGVTTDVTITDAKITFKLYTHTTAPSGYEASAVKVETSNISVLKDFTQVIPLDDNYLSSSEELKLMDVAPNTTFYSDVIEGKPIEYQNIYTKISSLYAERYNCIGATLKNNLATISSALDFSKPLLTNMGNEIDITNYQIVSNIYARVIQENGATRFDFSRDVAVRLKSDAFKGVGKENLIIACFEPSFDQISFSEVESISDDMATVTFDGSGYFFVLQKI